MFVIIIHFFYFLFFLPHLIPFNILILFSVEIFVCFIHFFLSHTYWHFIVFHHIYQIRIIIWLFSEDNQISSIEHLRKLKQLLSWIKIRLDWNKYTLDGNILWFFVIIYFLSSLSNFMKSKRSGIRAHCVSEEK